TRHGSLAPTYYPQPRPSRGRMGAMSLEQAVAEATPLPGRAQGKGRPSRRVRAEQLALLCRQWLRLPVPILLLCVYIAYLCWGYVAQPAVLGWAGLTLGILIVRSAMIVALRRGEQIARDPDVWALRLTVLAALSGIISGSAAPLFFNAL